MKKITVLLLSSLLLMTISCQQPQVNKFPWEDYGWKLAVQAYSFNRFTFEETLNFAKELDLKYIEAYPGQKIGAGSEGTTHFNMSNDDRELVRSLLKKHQIEMINYGIVAANSEEEWEQLFSFAADMGIQTIGSEPDPIWMDLIDELTVKYDIQLAIHNHPPPTRYWNPETVAETIAGRNSLIGASADNGHWMRTGIDPIVGYSILESRIKYLHFKDMSAFGEMDAHTVPFGTGVLDMPATLKHLRQIGFKGVITIEYEWDWDNPTPKIAESIAYLKEITANL
ncbi:sugar phosphate isomerase/epimerase family protein [Alkaliflexus imshenetskii]|uniref:sugar phosphate isomerase/epimerase family protein n=1 Tax=Alkaliflexus imshenetskii TaxID=286730 RepID=UPI0004798074|nr:sugar phosphate isomerase/epimerase family protein [Alkaliflexus imshenetskii]